VNVDPGAGALMFADPDTVPPAMFTDNPGEKADTTAVLVALRACAFTGYVPTADHVFDAFVVPTGSHPELVPSPQSNKYCTALPKLEVDPPVL
jgi:hypothetical protein